MPAVPRLWSQVVEQRADLAVDVGARAQLTSQRVALGVGRLEDPGIGETSRDPSRGLRNELVVRAPFVS